jgi:hypothetical protein
MGKQKALRFRLPDEEARAELCQTLKLSKAQAAALNAVLQEAESGCIDLAKELEIAQSELKRRLKTIDRLLSNAHQGLQRAGIRRALASIEMNGAISYLLSPEAGSDIHENTALDGPEHDRLLNDRTPEVMSYLLDRMRRPIAEWLAIAANDKGGNKPKSDRQLLILLLARDSRQIIEEAASASSNGPFHNLCSWVLPACGIGMEGLEDAITRCLKKYREWLCWAQLPTAEHIVGVLAPSDTDAIPDDPEADLT